MGGGSIGVCGVPGLLIPQGVLSSPGFSAGFDSLGELFSCARCLPLIRSAWSFMSLVIVMEGVGILCLGWLVAADCYA